jgi:hypothetical protein
MSFSGTVYEFDNNKLGRLNLIVADSKTVEGNFVDQAAKTPKTKFATSASVVGGDFDFTNEDEVLAFLKKEHFSQASTFASNFRIGGDKKIAEATVRSVPQTLFNKWYCEKYLGKDSAADDVGILNWLGVAHGTNSGVITRRTKLGTQTLSGVIQHVEAAHECDHVFGRSMNGAFEFYQSLGLWGPAVAGYDNYFNITPANNQRLKVASFTPNAEKSAVVNEILNDSFHFKAEK